MDESYEEKLPLKKIRLGYVRDMLMTIQEPDRQMRERETRF